VPTWTAAASWDCRTETLLPAALIVFAGYTMFGVTGFGASPITVPVLAHFLPLPFVLSLAAALDLGSAAALGVHTKKQADVRELLVLAPFTIIGLAIGVTLLVSLPRDATLFALGVFVCGYALYIMLQRGIPFGILVGLNRHVSEMFYPILNFFQSISGIALLPILVHPASQWVAEWCNDGSSSIWSGGLAPCATSNCTATCLGSSCRGPSGPWS